MMSTMLRRLLPCTLLGGALLSAALPALSRAADAPALDPALVAAEKERIEAIEKVRPAVVAVFDPSRAGGGSGVLISPEGYALTNYHVVEQFPAAGGVSKAGLPDGVLYDCVLVGLDKVGDVALIKLLPKKEGDKFPFAPMGDSDKVRAGDWSLAMGNPFLLATDFTPTVTYGMISGVHRYQYPAGTLLEYTDCIQFDTSINPGNSGGPLFNMKGELIGINGRGSFEKRGRVNSGVGYAISINQIKNFLGQLRAGMDTDHASLGAFIDTDSDEGPLGKLTVTNIIDCDAARRGLDKGDELVSFNGKKLTSVNQYKNQLGLYPRGWRVPLVYREKDEKHEILVRLMGVQRREIGPRGAPEAPPMGGPPVVVKPSDSPAARLYEAKPGFANYYFNKLERDRLLKDFHAAFGEYKDVNGDWTIRGAGEVKKRNGPAEIAVKYRGADDKANDRIDAIFLGGFQSSLEPVRLNLDMKELMQPDGSGGLLVAMYHYYLFMKGDESFHKTISHGGAEPFYLPPAGDDKPDYAKLRVDCEVIRSRYSGIDAKWYFALADDAERKVLKHQLVGFEVLVDGGGDPCEVYLLDYQKSGARTLPKRLVVRYGGAAFCDLGRLEFTLEKAK